MGRSIYVCLLLIRRTFCHISYRPSKNISEYKVQLTSVRDTFDTFTTKICDVIKESRMIEAKDVRFRDYPVGIGFLSYRPLMYALETLLSKTQTRKHSPKKRTRTPLIEGGKKLWLEFGVNQGYSIIVTASIRLLKGVFCI
jgi:hypothetical protein